jgi:hypothetical protein
VKYDLIKDNDPVMQGSKRKIANYLVGLPESDDLYEVRRESDGELVCRRDFKGTSRC